MNCNKQFFKNPYDQLNRIKRANVFMADAGVVSSNTWTSAGLDATKYAESYTFDRNGNIETLKRQSHQGVMDDLGYVYETVDGHKVNNRLLQVTDAYSIQGMGDVGNQVPNNYGYDALGNLVRNEQENIESIEWTVSGKVHKIIRNSSEQTLPDMEFEYDPSGNRIVKLVKPRSGGVLADQAAWDYTYYVRDAQGNIMATYKQTGTGAPLSLSDFSLYGSDRLGTLDVDKPLAEISFTGSYAHYMGKKQCELKNHLGNVLATVSDYAQPQYTGATLTGFTAQLLTAQDYYPFGMIMPGRSFSSNGYRFGFQGQEKDDEISGSTGSHVNYKYRIDDVRIGRFLSVDPLSAKYPHNSSYAFSENRVIDAVELEGLEAFFVHGMNSNSTVWKDPKFQEFANSAMQLTNNTTENYAFNWGDDKGNGIFQKKIDRTNAAKELVQYVLDNRDIEEEVTLIGVSHGGNVSIQAAKILGSMGYKVNIITLNTTAFQDEGDSENPSGNEGINDMIDIRTRRDRVSALVRGAGTFAKLYKGIEGATNTYDGPGQTIEIKNDKLFFLFRHSTKNVDETQIDNSNLKKLKSVDEELIPIKKP